MNSGVIIVFSNDESEISDFEKKYLSSINTNKICFVNNASSDKTLSLLKDIQFKSGARLLSSESEFDFIVYLKSNMLESLIGLTAFLKNFQENKQDYKALPTRSNRNVLFDVFSICELLNKECIA